MPAADHAAATLDAARPIGSAAIEIRIAHRLARRAEEHADLGRLIRLAAPQVAGNLVQHVIRFSRAGGRRHSEHPLGRGVVGRQILLPIAQRPPARIFKHLIGRYQQRIGIHQAAAADASAVQHHHVAQHRDRLDAEAPHQRRPEKLADVPVRLGKILRPPPLAALQHADPIALLRQPQRRHAAAKAGADDDIVEIEIKR